MFAQIIRGTVSDREAVRPLIDRWKDDLAPGARGWLGSTSGITEDGQLFTCVRFESEEAARANSSRPEQDQWWAEFSKLIDGEATFQDSNEVMVEAVGDMDTARFVQVMIGQSTNPERSQELMKGLESERGMGRPDILGSVSVGHGDGKFTTVLYFIDEASAREGERKEPPPEVKAAITEMMSLMAIPIEYLDLSRPLIDSGVRRDSLAGGQG